MSDWEEQSKEAIQTCGRMYNKYDDIEVVGPDCIPDPTPPWLKGNE